MQVKKVKIRETCLTLIVNISMYNIDIENRLRQVLRLSEPIIMIYISLGLDENWLSYRAPQPRIEVVRGLRPRERDMPRF
jgi:hypothetical protein